ncbi:putative 4-coumarate--CoA ligase 3 [Blattella germanica]|nr:putative 4-coumarate--CoA ligase 3 [Blattella germanica]
MTAWSSLCRVVARRARSFSSVRGISTIQDHNVVKSPYKAVSIPNINLVDFVWSAVEKVPEKTALICAVTGREYTYAEARKISQRFAVSLQKAGFKKGDVIAVVLPNIPEFPLILFGAIEAGLIVTTVNPTYTADEIFKQLINSGAIGVVTIPEIHETVQKAVKTLEAQIKRHIPIFHSPGLGESSSPEGIIKFEDMTSSNIDVSTLITNKEWRSDDVAVMPYSSGTTGLPKGVKLSHLNLVMNCTQIISEPKVTAAIRASGDYQDVIPALLPLYHIYGLVAIAIAALNYGSKVVTASMLYLVPPLIQFMASHPDVKGSYLNSVRCVNNGAAPVGPNDVDRFLTKAPQVTFMQGYGLTETSPVCCILEKGSTKYVSSGKPIPNTEMKIINRETGENLGPNENGEVCVKGPQVMLGYHNNPEATAETIDSTGWLHTGDMGYYDDDKDFFIVDRYKELIKVKGLQVAPAELEDILRSHPGVADAAVIGIPDQRSGEVPRAYVILKDSKLTENDVKKFISEKVSEHKHLAGGVEFVTSIPKNPSGKILRRKLKEMYSK